MRRLLLLALLVAAGAARAQADQATALRLTLRPDMAWRFAESLSGKGTLTRLRGVSETALGIEVQATGTRLWQHTERTDEGARVSARSTAGLATLRLSEAPADGVDAYRRERPFRSYSLLVTPLGAVLDAELLHFDDEPEPGSHEPPVELDLTELFTALELGLLPPAPLAVGGSWQFPGGTGEQDTTRLALQAKGKLLELSEVGGRTMATMETSLTAALPARPTPLKDLLVSGEVTLSARIGFDVAAGRVERAAGPLTLDLRYAYPDARGTVAKVRLNLVIEARQVTAEPAR